MQDVYMKIQSNDKKWRKAEAFLQSYRSKRSNEDGIHSVYEYRYGRNYKFGKGLNPVVERS